MKLTDVPTRELRQMLRATEAAAGTDSPEATIIRRELAKRQQAGREAAALRRFTSNGGAVNV